MDHQTTDEDQLEPAVFAAVAVVVVIAVCLLVWGLWPDRTTPQADPTAAVADSALSAEATIARTGAAADVARADSLARVTAELSDQNARLAAELDRLTRRTDRLLSTTARTVHALAPDSLARTADRALARRLR